MRPDPVPRTTCGDTARKTNACHPDQLTPRPTPATAGCPVERNLGDGSNRAAVNAARPASAGPLTKGSQRASVSLRSDCRKHGGIAEVRIAAGAFATKLLVEDVDFLSL